MAHIRRAAFVIAAGIMGTVSLGNGASTTATESRIPDSIPGVTVKRDVSYLPPDRTEKLDLYLPEGRISEKLSPAILMIHGGGWVGGRKDARREIQMGTTFARNGYVAASVEYIKEEGKRWPTNLHDCKNAVRYLRTNAEELGVDPENIGVIGGSAGGHLALMVAFVSGAEALEPQEPYPGVSSEVQACVNLYGVADITKRQGTDKEGNPDGVFRVRNALFDNPVTDNRKEWLKASPVTYVGPNVPPVLTIHGTADETVDRDQATLLDREMKSAGANHTLMLIEGAPHSFLLEDKRLKENLTPIVMEFFDKHLRDGASSAVDSETTGSIKATVAGD